jgi:hypothetical protein
MGRDIRIEEVNGGYILRAWEPQAVGSGPVMYDSMKDESSIVAATKAEVKDILDGWLNGTTPPFKKKEE